MWRTIDKHLRFRPIALTLASSSPPTPPLTSLRTVTATHPNPHRTLFSVPSPPKPPPSLAFSAARCATSATPAQALDWTEPAPSPSLGHGGNGRPVDDDAKPCIPVRAYFFSTRFRCPSISSISIFDFPFWVFFFSEANCVWGIFGCSVDLRRLMEQYKGNFIPPTSRTTNYIVLKFGELCDPHVRLYSSSSFLFFFFFLTVSVSCYTCICLSVAENRYTLMKMLAIWVYS